MQNKDEFDGPDFRSAIGSIFSALDRQQGRVEPRQPVWAAAIVLSLIAFLGSVLWYGYPREAQKQEIMAVPIIRADAGPYKIVPRDPGGMNIPHRDSTVFDTLRVARGGDEEIRRIENLLPEAEAPLPREQLFAGLKTEIKVEGRAINTAPATERQEQPQAVADAPVQAKSAPEAQPEVKTAAVTTPTPAAKPEKEIAEEVSRTEPAAGVETFEGSYFAQIASLKSNAAAESAWTAMLRELHVLRPYKHRVQRADLGAKGVYYRVQAGPMSQAQAKQVCEAIKAQRPGGCLVIQD